jgi:DNA-binding response OmpR family regulator
MALPATLHLHIPNMRIDIACSPVDALTALKHAHYDVILSDLRMPQMGGLQFIEEARAISRDTTILMMSGIGDRGVALRAMDAGVFDFLVKPFDRRDVRNSIRAALRCHALREKASWYRARLVRLSEQSTKLHTIYHFRERPSLDRFKNGDARRAIQQSYGIMEATIDHYGRSVELMRRRIESLEACLAQATLRADGLEREARRRALNRFLAAPSIG